MIAALLYVTNLGQSATEFPAVTDGSRGWTAERQTTWELRDDGMRWTDTESIRYENTSEGLIAHRQLTATVINGDRVPAIPSQPISEPLRDAESASSPWQARLNQLIELGLGRKEPASLPAVPGRYGTVRLAYRTSGPERITEWREGDSFWFLRLDTDPTARQRYRSWELTVPRVLVPGGEDFASVTVRERFVSWEPARR